MYVKYIANPRPNSYSGLGFHVDYSKDKDEPIELRMALPTGVYDYVARLTWQEWEKRGGLVCLNSAARFDKWNRAAVR